MRLSLRFKLLGILSLILAINGLSAFVSIYAQQWQDDLSAKSEYHYQVLRALQDLQRGLLSMERYMQSYYIEKDNSSLHHYEESKDSVRRSLSKLIDLTKKDVIQKERWKIIEKQLLEYDQKQSKNLWEASSQGVMSSADYSLKEWLRRMDGEVGIIRTMARDAENSELTALRTVQNKQREALFIARYISVGGTVLSFFIGLGLVLSF